MKISELKIGDLVKYQNNGVTTETQGNITKIELPYLFVKGYWGEYKIHYDLILAKLEEIPKQYKEIPIEKPYSFQTNLLISEIGSYPRHAFDRYPLLRIRGYFSNGGNFEINGVDNLNLDLNKQYTLEIKEKI